MSKIKVLDKKVYNKIAAGEVVEKPASIIKELIENSLDAKATKISIEIRNGGINEIVVQDNGCGIPKDEVKLAFTPHATSKIDEVSDLFKLNTFGFRGEALASIAAVARVKMITKTENEELATEISINGGDFDEIKELASSQGTKIQVCNLFYNIPVRAKFLRKPKTEENDITTYVQKLILSNPNISFKYTIDDSIIYQTTGSGLYDAIYTIYGKECIDNIIETHYSKDGYCIDGYISKPQFVKSNKSYISLFVNGRYVQNYIINSAICTAYEDFLMKGKFPFCVLNLSVPTYAVDVNVHPNKLEVKFENTNSIYSLFTNSILNTLYNYQHIVEVDASSLQKDDNENNKVTIENRTENINENATTSITNNPIKIDKFVGVSFPQQRFELEDDKIIFGDSARDIKTYDISDNTPTNNNTQKIIEPKNQQEEIIFDSSIFKQIGIAFDTYIIIEQNNNLYFIDQHAAHERQIYDKFINEIKTDSIKQQNLLIPFIINCNNEENEFIENSLNILKESGFEIESFGHNCFKIFSVPYVLSEINLKTYFELIFADLGKVIKKPMEYIKEYFTQRACKAAVKAGNKLSSQEINILLTEFNNSKHPLLCPHGRPIVFTISRNEFEKLFKRTL